MIAPVGRLTSESRAALRRTVRELREMLLRQVREYAEQRYLLKLKQADAAQRLSQAMRERRRRLEAALDERAAEEGGAKKEARERAFDAAVKEASATFLNRLVLLRHLEAMGLSKPAVVTGGWSSPGYKRFRDFAPELIDDDTQGFSTLLELLFGELSAAMPGLFGAVGLTPLLPIPPAALRAVVEALDELPAEAWSDDMTLGWVYQYWNDPDREALDAKLNERGKLEPHELASKTQMFTERYMVEWLLHNSLGPTWLAICKKNGWTAEVEQGGVLKALDDRRAEWRMKRDAGEVAPDALMPINGALEEAWKYYVPQPLPDEVVTHAPSSIRELKLLDPACGSGHFLVVAFDLLALLYREEARHSGENWSDQQIAESILENNLHGVDIDPRAVQIAAAGLYLKAKTMAKDAEPANVNLVAPALRLSALNPKDESLQRLASDIEAETGIPPALTAKILEALGGVDHLGTLLKVGDAVDKAIEEHQGPLSRAGRQKDLFAKRGVEARTDLDRDAARTAVLNRLNDFLAKHAAEEDLGLRLRGEQLTAGLRFASIVQEGRHHLVVGNPPYQGTSRMKDARYIEKHYPRGKSDLYAAFLERALELCRAGGASAMVTMRNWMFLSGFTALREHLLKTFDLRIIGDLDKGAFESMPTSQLISVVMSVIRATSSSGHSSVALQPTAPNEKYWGRDRTDLKRAALMSQVGRHSFSVGRLTVVEGRPLIYWWDDETLSLFSTSKGLGMASPAVVGVTTGDLRRFSRFWWETVLTAHSVPTPEGVPEARWFPFIGGGKGLEWIEPLREVCSWLHLGLEVKTKNEARYGTHTKQVRSEHHYFRKGVTFSMIGAEFGARAHRYRSIFSDKGSSSFPSDVAATVCMLNSTRARGIIQALNPSISFQVGDVNRLPVLSVDRAEDIFARINECFSARECGREASIEYAQPGASSWISVQEWAQRAVDRPPGAPLPPFAPELMQPTEHDRLSFEIGVAMGRIGRSGEGVLASAPTTSLPHGILFVTVAGLRRTETALAGLFEVWRNRDAKVKTDTLERWLRDGFFDYHRKLYENRPIYFPLSSSKRSFIAYVSIHRWTDSTLSTLLAEHLIPERKAIEGALADLQTARNSSDKKAKAAAAKSFAQHEKWLEELEDFIRKVQQIAEKGPPPPDDKTPERETDAPYRMDLDDGVMVNSAALWPLLEPMWKDPKKWWRELASAKGKKDYDWSHLAARYFPTRVDEKCRKDPSLGVAHGCFWKYHPEKAYQWELRLQDEIGPDFTIDEKDSDKLRAEFTTTHAARVSELVAAEQVRRDRKAKKQDQEELELSESDDGDEPGGDEDEAA